MKVSNDKYELPLIVADSVVELADKLGVKQTNISSAISHAIKRGSKSQYVKVEITDESEVINDDVTCN